MFKYSNAVILFLIILLANTGTLKAANSIDEVRSYIGNIKSAAIEFTQTDSEGNSAKGMLVIDKPYKFRCNYYTPFPLLIIGNKNYVSVYDYEMEHLSRISAKENIFYFLLVDQINFAKQFNILSTKESADNYTIMLEHIESGKTSQIGFNKKNKQIAAIKIFEDNKIITLKFAEAHNVRNVDKGLFIIQDPDIFGTPKRLNKKQLQQKLKLVVAPN